MRCEHGDVDLKHFHTPPHLKIMKDQPSIRQVVAQEPDGPTLQSLAG